MPIDGTQRHGYRVQHMLHSWILLLLSLPPRPSSLRVRAWRRLRGLGAVPLKSGAYLLPDSADRYEQFQWLAQEIQRDGGDATLLRADRIENMPEAGRRAPVPGGPQPGLRGPGRSLPEAAQGTPATR